MNGTKAFSLSLSFAVNQSQYVASFFFVVRFCLLSDSSGDGVGGDEELGSMCKIACKIYTKDRQATEEDSWR